MCFAKAFLLKTDSQVEKKWSVFEGDQCFRKHLTEKGYFEHLTEYSKKVNIKIDQLYLRAFNNFTQSF